MHWPGWDSLQAVARVHDVLKVASIALSALMVVAATATYRYAAREKELERARAADERASAERERAEAVARAKAAGEAAIRAEAKAAALEGRHLTGEQAEAMTRALAKLPGGQVDILSGDAESMTYADELASAMRSAGWSAVSRSGLGTWDYSPHPGYVLIFRGSVVEGFSEPRDDLAQLPPASVPSAGRALANVLRAAGIHAKFGLTSGTSGEMLLLVGYKPPSGP